MRQVGPIPTLTCSSVFWSVSSCGHTLHTPLGWLSHSVSSPCLPDQHCSHNLAGQALLNCELYLTLVLTLLTGCDRLATEWCQPPSQAAQEGDWCQAGANTPQYLLTYSFIANRPAKVQCIIITKVKNMNFL